MDSIEFFLLLGCVCPRLYFNMSTASRSSDNGSTTTTLPTQTSPPSTTSDSKHVVEGKSLNLRVIDQRGSLTPFKIRATTPLNKLMNVYCERAGIDRSSVRFLYDGNHIRDGETASSLGMEDEDIIDVMLQQTGGCL